MVFCYLNILQTKAALASDINTNTGTGINSITIQQFPSKMTYYQGDKLDFSDMILCGNYSDGTVSKITDYEVSGYDSNTIGKQTVIISYQGYVTSVDVTVLPAKVTNISVTNYSTSSITFTWDSIAGAIKYEIYSYDAASQTYLLASVTDNNSVTLNYSTATYHSIQICAVVSVDGKDLNGGMSEPFIAATAPDAATGLIATKTTATTVTLAWNSVPGATGYIIYRSKNSGKDFSVIKVTKDTSYKNSKLTSASCYQYKVAAYTYSDAYFGQASNMVDISTNAAKMVLKVKSGEKKVRVTWDIVEGAYSYDLYISDDANGYKLVTSRDAKNTCKYVIKDLIIGNSYKFYAVARRKYNDKVYDSAPSDVKTVKITVLAPTSTEAKYLKTKEDFLDSVTYKDIGYFRQYINYTKSFVIPGLITTNVDGFSSSAMCPQAIAFAGKYLLQSAYDKGLEENSVIYVLDKTTKNLITTLVLPSKAHVGGIAFDGINLWITRGTSVVSVQFSQVEAAVALGAAYYSIKFDTCKDLKIQASFLTYYKDKLWVGSYDEFKETKMYSYLIQKKDSTPGLLKADAITMPNRVQGVTFTSKGELIVSRSCQQYLGLRGYIRQIDIYRPDFTNESKGIIALGQSVNSVEMPSMNEGIAINGSYIYVTFESAAFNEATYQMDHICAFKLSTLFKKDIVKPA